MAGDVIITVLVLWALWTFVPRHLRHALRTGLEPVIIALADGVRGGVRTVGKWIAFFAYRVLLGVKDLPLATSSDPDVMSRGIEQTEQTDGTDRPLSEADQWIDRLEVDRSKTALIELMVYAGWQVGEIRAVIKGDNGTIGTEVEAARKRLGMAPASEYRTPIGNRPTGAKFQQDLLP